MESLSFENLEIIHETLLNIRKSISMLLEWNEGVQSTDEWTDSPSGMQKLAANCMLIEAIGEAIRKIEKRASREFLNQRPEIPWQDEIRLSGGTINEKDAGSANHGGYKGRTKKETNGAERLHLWVKTP